jgi:hypothetical protein
MTKLIKDAEFVPLTNQDLRFLVAFPAMFVGLYFLLPTIISLGITGFLVAFVYLIFLFFFGFSFLILLISLPARKRARFSIFEDRVEFQSGRTLGSSLSMVTEIPNSKIESVSILQLGRKKLDWGTVTISGSGGTKILAGPISNPEKIVEIIRNISGLSQGANPFLSDELFKLEALYKSGTLSESEYTAAKAKILGL